VADEWRDLVLVAGTPLVVSLQHPHLARRDPLKDVNDTAALLFFRYGERRRGDRRGRQVSAPSSARSSAELPPRVLSKTRLAQWAFVSVSRMARAADDPGAGPWCSYAVAEHYLGLLPLLPFLGGGG